jgi:hypothetical protein
MSDKDLRKNVHTTRAQDTVHGSVHGDEHERPWEPPSNLAAPPARPGYGQKWVRVAIRNEDDATNVSKAFREGWAPRRADTAPADFRPPTISHGEFAGCIGVHGMILCEMPETRIAQRKSYYEGRTRQQTQAIEQDLLRDQVPGHPIHQDRKSSVTVGRRPVVADD